MTETTMRDRFKKWAKTSAKFRDEPLDITWHAGDYLWPEAQLAWEAWQAAEEAAEADQAAFAQRIREDEREKIAATFDPSPHAEMFRQDIADAIRSSPKADHD